MKKWLKFTLGGIGGVLVLGAGAIVVKFYALSPEARAVQQMTAPNTPEALARGKYLTEHVLGCETCHSPIDESQPGGKLRGVPFSGRNFNEDVPGDWPGTVAGPNLTPDKNSGLGNWSDGEIVRALREGIGKDGRALFPMMPYPVYREVLSDSDALAIVAYLRSLPANDRNPGKTKLDFPVSMFIRLAPKPVPTPIAAPPSDPDGYASWILKASLCASCHSPTDDAHEELPGKQFSGGTEFVLPGGTYYSANITPDPETGIGKWTDEQLLAVLDGKGHSGRPVMAMPTTAYVGMTEADKKAIVRALRALKPVSNKVPDWKGK